MIWTKDIICKRIGMNPNNVVSLYHYGSRVYGNYTDKSDWDFICVVKDKPNEQFSDNLININFYTIESHTQRLLNHEISALETLWIDPIYTDRHWSWELNLKRLRKSLSAKSSNSWVKAKKKLTVEKDYDSKVGKKSLWHSIRIFDFGYQIATEGKIVNYGSCNDIYFDIMYNYHDWETLFNRYKNVYNGYRSKFKEVAPK